MVRGYWLETYQFLNNISDLRSKAGNTSIKEKRRVQSNEICFF